MGCTVYYSISPFIVYYECFTLTHGSPSSVHLKDGAECTEFPSCHCWQIRRKQIHTRCPCLRIVCLRCLVSKSPHLSTFSNKNVKHLLVQAPGSTHFTHTKICIWYSVSATFKPWFLLFGSVHATSSFFSSYRFLFPSVTQQWGFVLSWVFVSWTSCFILNV